MKAILTFDLPDDEVAHSLAVHGQDFALVCTDMDEWLRQQLKYAELPEDAAQALQNARDMLYKCLDDHGVSLEMVR